MSGSEVTIRSIQHFLYCPHRWGLIEIENAWAENFYVTKANLIHERVHNPENVYALRGKKVFTSVPVFNDLEQYNLYGVVDCLELTKDINGISINNSDDKYKISIVEYKPTHPKEGQCHEDDAMQVFAQKICVDYVFGGNCNAEIFYADIKKRVTLPVKEQFFMYDNSLKAILQKMRYYLDNGIVPQIEKKQKCSGCSMKEMCMPSLKQKRSIREEIAQIEGHMV